MSPETDGRLDAIEQRALDAKNEAVAVRLELVTSLGGIRTILAEINGKADTLTARMDEHFARLNGTIIRHDTVLSQLDERQRRTESDLADRPQLIARLERADEVATERLDLLDRMKVSREALQPIADGLAAVTKDTKALTDAATLRRGGAWLARHAWGILLAIAGLAVGLLGLFGPR